MSLPKGEHIVGSLSEHQANFNVGGMCFRIYNPMFAPLKSVIWACFLLDVSGTSMNYKPIAGAGSVFDAMILMCRS